MASVTDSSDPNEAAKSADPAPRTSGCTMAAGLADSIPCTHSTSTQLHESPQDIAPYPKAPKRKRERDVAQW